MQSRYSRFIRIVHFSGDIILLNISFLLSYRLGVYENIYENNYLTLLLFFNLFWIIVISFVRIYDIYRVTRIEQVIYNLAKAIFWHVLFIFTLVTTIKLNSVSDKHLLFTYLFFIVLVFIWRILVLKALKIYRRKGFNYRRVIIAGAGPIGNSMMEFLTSDMSYGYKFLGFFDDNLDKCIHKDLVLGNIKQIEDYATANLIDEIYCALPDSAGKKVRELIEFADKNLIRIKIIPDFMRFIPKKVVIDFYGSIPVILMRREPLQNLFNRFIKRVFDVAFSILVIVLIFPWLLPAIAGLVIFSSPGPIFFRQKRTGENGEEFFCWKFRTMRVNNEADERQATQNDERITPIGKFLRKTNFDELPQFFNVLVGDMSVVGPRPHMLKHTEEYSQIIHQFMVRHFVQPGITGWAQVHGFRGETIDPQLMRKRVQYDVWYIENWSFLLDLRIVFLTVRNMLRGEKNAV